MDRYIVVSSDGHAGPPAELYRDYLDPEFRSRFDEHQETVNAFRASMETDSSKRFKEEWDEETGDHLTVKVLRRSVPIYETARY